MKSLALERLLVLVCLPTASWAGHVTFDMVRQTSPLSFATVTPLPAALRGWPAAQFTVNEATTNADRVARKQATYGCSYICLDVSTANVTDTSDPFSDSGLSAGAFLVNAIPGPSTSLSPGGGIAYIARIIDGQSPITARLAQRGEYTQALTTLLLLGFIWLTPTFLYHRMSIAKSHRRRRRSHPPSDIVIT